MQTKIGKNAIAMEDDHVSQPIAMEDDHGGQLARAAGAVAKLIAKEGKSATLKLPSGEVRLIPKNCSATVGQVGNVGVNQKSLGRAGSKRWLGKRPVLKSVDPHQSSYGHMYMQAV
ncbi:hypothetical protein F8388_016633 [Cannabis sativa]|uniref:Large ribosomal subunit protein uL2 C-terminal domain-containing protein n=1 Tax=Cannabis sativa TaxID=3483 RepID=A0A7J6FDG0_CANSA|nr:hypothetical protein F8388_016633 [Cannabis sativa]